MPGLSGGWRTGLITGMASKTRLARAPASSRWLVVAKVALGGGFGTVVPPRRDVVGAWAGDWGAAGWPSGRR